MIGKPEFASEVPVVVLARQPHVPKLLRTGETRRFSFLFQPLSARKHKALSLIRAELQVQCPKSVSMTQVTNQLRYTEDS